MLIDMLLDLKCLHVINQRYNSKFEVVVWIKIHVYCSSKMKLLLQCH